MSGDTGRQKRTQRRRNKRRQQVIDRRAEQYNCPEGEIGELKTEACGRSGLQEYLEEERNRQDMQNIRFFTDEKIYRTAKTVHDRSPNERRPRADEKEVRPDHYQGDHYTPGPSQERTEQ